MAMTCFCDVPIDATAAEMCGNPYCGQPYAFHYNFDRESRKPREVVEEKNRFLRKEYRLIMETK